MTVLPSAINTKVQVDFSGTAYGGTASFTDISADVMTSPQEPNSTEIQITWGREDWQDTVSPSTCSYNLRNQSGKYTPGNTSSLYSPWVRKRARTHVSTTISATTVDLFDGYWDSIEAFPQAGSYWYSEVSATDILGRMGADTPLRGFLVEEMVSDSPNCIYGLQEDEGARTFADLTGQSATGNIVTSGSPSVSDSGVDAGQDPNSSVLTSGTMVTVTNKTYPSAGGAAAYYLSLPTLTTFTSAGTWEGWVQTPIAPPGGSFTAWLFGSNNSGFTAGWAFQLTSAGKIALVVIGSGTTATATSTNAYCDGALHHLVGVMSGTSLTLYVDGLSAGTATISSSITINTGQPVACGVDPSNSKGPFTGGFAYIATYPTALTSGRVLSHYVSASTAWATERVDSNITRLLGYRKNLGAVLDTSPYFIGSGDCYGITLQDALLGNGQTDGGAVFANSQGKIAFRSRSRLAPPTTALTLDASLGDVDIPTSFRDDIQNVTNDVTVSRANGSDQRAFSATSITQDGEATLQLDVNIDTDTNAMALANWLLAFGITEQIGCPALTINLFTVSTAAKALAILQLAPLDVIQIINLPAQAPSSSMTLMVQGGSYTISSEEFSVGLLVTPVP
jgi:hypothetical protein